jgi:hypothetical protein
MTVPEALKKAGSGLGTGRREATGQGNADFIVFWSYVCLCTGIVFKANE